MKEQIEERKKKMSARNDRETEREKAFTDHRKGETRREK